MTQTITENPLCVLESYFSHYSNFKFTTYSVENKRGIYKGTQIEEIEILWVRTKVTRLCYQLGYRKIYPNITKWEKAINNRLIKNLAIYGKNAYPCLSEKWRPAKEEEVFAIFLQNNELREFQNIIEQISP